MAKLTRTLQPVSCTLINQLASVFIYIHQAEVFWENTWTPPWLSCFSFFNSYQPLVKMPVVLSDSPMCITIVLAFLDFLSSGLCTWISSCFFCFSDPEASEIYHRLFILQWNSFWFKFFIITLFMQPAATVLYLLLIIWCWFEISWLISGCWGLGGLRCWIKGFFEV